MIALLALVICGVVIAAVVLRRRLRQRQIREFDEQLPEALEMLGRMLRSGHGVAQGLEFVGSRREGAVAREFKRAWEDQNTGQSLEEAIRGITARVESRDAVLFSLAVAVNQEYGGNLAESFDRIATTTRSRRELADEIGTLTTPGKVGAFIAVLMPIGMAIALAWIRPGHLDPLWNTWLGRMFSLASIAQMVVGVYLMRRIASSVG
jgi:tight adherence protein B